MNKQAKHDRRKKLVYDRIREAMPTTRAQKLVFDLSRSDNQHYREIEGHAGMAAVQLVADTLSEFNLPFWPNLVYAGMDREAGSGAHGIETGIILVHGEMRSLSGVKDSFDIPIKVEGGKMLPPSVVFHNGTVNIIAQSTFDDMLERLTSYRDVPHRANMFQPPPDSQMDYPPYNKEWPRREILNHDMFTHAASRRDEKKKVIQAAMRGYVIHEAQDEETQQLQMPTANKKEALVSHDNYLDEAERDTCGRYWPGQTVKIKKECVLGNRGGGIYVIPSGTEAEIIRDMDGTGRLFYACFTDRNMKGIITIHHIEGTTNPRDRERGEYDETWSHPSMRDDS